MLHDYFKITGSRFISKLGHIEEDSEMACFKTSIPSIEMSKRLIVNVEKEFSDKKYDIKIFEVKVKNQGDQRKYQIEIFCVEQPNVIFRTDFLSETHS